MADAGADALTRAANAIRGYQGMRSDETDMVKPPVVRVELLADHPHLIPAVGEIRWKEWGRPPEPEELDWWVDVTAKEAGRAQLPVTWVAIDELGAAVGAVGIGELDIEEITDRSPWVLGMIVSPERRDMGVGTKLIRVLERWARDNGYPSAWVATGERASDFYEKCGWQPVETVEKRSGDIAKVLLRLF